ncbi:PilZ domain-containing protein [Geobacter sp. FeAm09]|uniref:PilZ domain-containing protein n=1 Tax=Geobacter sp. FeAm09 TaxID=2597769 RepID=UPI00143D308D|nr:PilZ domain-containing protein [Geobacter sp. FeAm09]
MRRAARRYRIERGSRCVLHHGGTDYPGTVANISLGGALLRLSGGSPAPLRPGAVCVLLLCSKPHLCPVKYTCQVVRCDDAAMAVQFHELDYGSYRVKCRKLLLALTA